MALAPAKLEKVRVLLGFSALPDNDDNPRLELRLGTLTVTQEAEVDAILVEIAALDAVLSQLGASTASTGSIKRADEVEFYPVNANSSGAASSAQDNAISQGRRLIGRLSIMLGVPKVGEYYGADGYRGDGAYTRPGFQGMEYLC